MVKMLGSIYPLETYQDLLKEGQKIKLQCPLHFILALHPFDPFYFPKPSVHPFAAHIDGGKKSLSGLIYIIKHEQRRKKYEAVEAITHIFTQEGGVAFALAWLYGFMKEQMQLARKDFKLIALLARCMAVGQDDSFLKEQVSRLADTDPAHVISAAQLLGYGKYEAAVFHLRKLVCAARFYEAPSAIWALGEIGNGAALSVLQEALKEGLWPLDCIMALGKMGSDTILPPLLSLIGQGTKFQRQSAYAALLQLILRQPKQGEPWPLLAQMSQQLICLIENQLQEPPLNLNMRTRFYMVLCLMCLGGKLGYCSFQRYFEIEKI